MFKKLKDKLAEEVKSSPQRIQQFAQAAQAAVTSASSSISDITNNDLFSIGDNDASQNSQGRVQTSPSKPQNAFQDVNLLQSTSDVMDYVPDMDQPRQRRLSNSSFASDVSFRLPSYETPSMYHLQSDVEVSASEADERGFSGGLATLDRVTKEQLYAAYKRTQERYTKYRNQYSDLARHYKLLERENAKARSVLVETQDKALRRISELKEQCSLEQSAKAHLEKALRVEIEEKNMKIDTLNTKIQLLQSEGIPNEDSRNETQKPFVEKENEVQLINLTTEHQTEDAASEITSLNNKIEKMEQLLNKYKESLKTTKEKNSQITADLQKVTHELELKNKEIDNLKVLGDKLDEAQKHIKQLNDDKEDLQNQVNTFDFNKARELSTLEIDLQKANEEIAELQKKIDVFHKREEENAISLAENKLSIHKELESKETEIKSLKDHLATSKKEIQSLNIVITDYKNKITSLEDEKEKLNNDCAELNKIKAKCNEMDAQIKELTKKCQSLEQIKMKAEEEYKCLQLQLKQETAEKLAMIDRNTYLESRNTQLSDENTKKNAQISNMESELKIYTSNKDKDDDTESNEREQLVQEANMWKEKCYKLESEIQEERVELVKLQEEIEKMLANHELLQTQNAEFRITIANLTSENSKLLEEVEKSRSASNIVQVIANDLRSLKSSMSETSDTTRSLMTDITDYVNKCVQHLEVHISNATAKYNKLLKEYEKLEMELDKNNNKNLHIIRESDKIREENIKLTEEYKVLSNKLKDLSKKYEASVSELNSLKSEKETIEKSYQDLQRMLENAKDQNCETLNHIQTMDEENKELINKLKDVETQNAVLVKQHDDLRKQCNKVNLKINDLEAEITTKTNEILKYQSIQENLEQEIAQYALKEEKLINSEQDKETFHKQINELSTKNKQLEAELKDLRDLQKVAEETITRLTSDIDKQTKDIGDKLLHITELEENIKTVAQENVRLKTDTSSFINNINQLQLEIDDIKKSHTEIEVEKDRLNNIIENLEKENHKETDTRYTQTEGNTKEEVPKNESTMFENKWVLENKQSAMTNTGSLNLSNTALQDLQDKYNILKAHNDALKDENRRLQTDVEGLQSYLTKISKENSSLNDKLREVIANSEHTGDDSANVDELRKELTLSLEKVNDLLRENSLLVEENLELKDQLQSHNYPKVKETSMNNNDKEVDNDKYDKLMQANSDLQKRNLDLEQINKSVNGNVSQLQEKNERLRLSNEKLERRLDEALVSLRHLHSLQENTELEYLRNILYEYLTGSGTHSVTLAKVLAAIVKFDDSQTQLVLQKEKERQGFLRQLGLI